MENMKKDEKNNVVTDNIGEAQHLNIGFTGDDNGLFSAASLFRHNSCEEDSSSDKAEKNVASGDKESVTEQSVPVCEAPAVDEAVTDEISVAETTADIPDSIDFSEDAPVAEDNIASEITSADEIPVEEDNTADELPTDPDTASTPQEASEEVKADTVPEKRPRRNPLEIPEVNDAIHPPLFNKDNAADYSQSRTGYVRNSNDYPIRRQSTAPVNSNVSVFRDIDPEEVKNEKIRRTENKIIIGVVSAVVIVFAILLFMMLTLYVF